MSEGNIARHRDYGLLMKRHHRDLRMRRLTIVLIYVLIIIAIAALFIVVKRDEQRRKALPSSSPATAMIPDGGLAPKVTPMEFAIPRIASTEFVL